MLPRCHGLSDHPRTDCARSVGLRASIKPRGSLLVPMEPQTKRMQARKPQVLDFDLSSTVGAEGFG